MSLDFLAVDMTAEHAGRTPLARSPMEREARAAGARFAVREGWNVAVGYAAGAGAARSSVGWADVSHLQKLEVQGSRDAVSAVAELAPGVARRAGGAWWCPVWPEKLLVVGGTPALRDRLERVEADVHVVDLTCAHGALAIVGPEARETLARFCALDLRPAVTPIGGFRPGSVARTPGYVLREAHDRFLVLFGSALGHYVWTQVADAARHLGGAPLGVDELEELPADA